MELVFILLNLLSLFFFIIAKSANESYEKIYRELI